MRVETGRGAGCERRGRGRFQSESGEEAGD